MKMNKWACLAVCAVCGFLGWWFYLWFDEDINLKKAETQVTTQSKVEKPLPTTWDLDTDYSTFQKIQGLPEELIYVKDLGHVWKYYTKDHKTFDEVTWDYREKNEWFIVEYSNIHHLLKLNKTKNLNFRGFMV